MSGFQESNCPKPFCLKIHIRRDIQLECSRPWRCRAHRSDFKGTVSRDFNQPNLVSKEISWEATTALNGFKLADSCAQRNERNSRIASSPKECLILCKGGAGGERITLAARPSLRVGAGQYSIAKNSQDLSIDSQFGLLKSHDTVPLKSNISTNTNLSAKWFLAWL